MMMKTEMTKTRAQYILEAIDFSDPTTQRAIVKGTIGLAIGADVAKSGMAQHIRTKYGLHGHVHDHRALMDVIKTKLPSDTQGHARRLARSLTLARMAAQIHHTREQEGKTPSTAQSLLTAKRAFHGTLTGTKIIMPNSPKYTWKS